MSSHRSGGKALVIVPAFFGYEKDIAAEFARQGYETICFDERPSDSAIGRAALRFRKEFMAGMIRNYYNHRWSELDGKNFDIVFVVKGEAIPRWFLERLRRSNPDARFVFYAWDALSNANNCLSVLDCFDQLFTFDPADAARREDFTYLPLFYTSEFRPLPEVASANRRHTLSFVGTLHTDRYAFVKKLFAGRSGTYAFFHVQARWYFALTKYLTKEHSAASWGEVSFHKLRRENVAEVFRNSAAVLDMPRRGQSGLTIRTFEVLASGAVLVTTNPEVINEPFFDSSRILVVPPEPEAWPSQEVLASKLDAITPPASAPDAFEQYSLASWVRTIIAG